MGKFKKKYSNFLHGNVSITQKLKKKNIFKSQDIKIFEFRIFEVLNLLYLRFSNFIICGLMNFKNVEIHILELTWQSIDDRSN